MAEEKTFLGAEALRQAIASVVIEGGHVAPETEALLEEMASGRLTEEEAIERLKTRIEEKRSATIHDADWHGGYDTSDIPAAVHQMGDDIRSGRLAPIVEKELAGARRLFDVGEALKRAQAMEDAARRARQPEEPGGPDAPSTRAP